MLPVSTSSSLQTLADVITSDAITIKGGRMYVTTLNLLSLEVYYRHLPIYEDTAK